MSNAEVVTVARELLAGEWDWSHVYTRLDALLACESAERVGELLVALVDLTKAPVRPSARWIFDLFPHVPEAAIDALASRERISRSLLGIGAIAPERLFPLAESLILSSLLEELPLGVGAMALTDLSIDRLIELGSLEEGRSGVAIRARRQLVDRWLLGETAGRELEWLDPSLSEDELLAVGVDPEFASVRFLGTSDAWVMRFPDDVRLLGCRSPEAAFARRRHPTWVPASGRTAGRFRFGGRGTTLASGNSLAHLLTLDLRAAGFDVEHHSVVAFELPRWVPLDDRPGFLRHARDGKPMACIGEAPVGSAIVAGVFVATHVDLVEVAPPYWLPDWGAAAHRDNLHRVGGRPAFIQRPDYPRCPDCGRRMPYVFQIGDGTPGDERAASVDEGLLYVFFCDRCGVSAYLHQST